MQIAVNLDQLDKLLAEKKFHLEVLRLWQHVHDNLGGYDDEVKSFMFEERWLTKDERRVQDSHYGQHRKPYYSGLTHHNAVRLRDGSILPIPMIERPEPPEHMKVSIEEKL